MLSVRRLMLAAALFVLALMLGAPGAAAAPSDRVLVTQVDGVITPVIAGHLADAVQAAESGGYQALLVELDTPGGLDSSMRDIIQAFLNSRVPVIVYVSPSGARAASAGALITFSANIAAMAPGTTIGAATPVDVQSGQKASDKVINDAAAYAESVAAQRGRDVGFAVDTVRQGRAVSATEAVRIHAVDLIAVDGASLLKQIDGRKVTVANGVVTTLSTADASTVDYGLGVMRKLLQVLADPNLAFLFLSLGTLAIMYELAYPGHAVSGVVGVILLILGFFALSVLPVSVAGLALLALAAGLFAAELFAPGLGVFAVGGAIALALSGVFLFEGSMRVSPAVFLPTAAVVGIGSLVAGRLTWRARRSPPVSGPGTMIGKTSVVARANGGSAYVHVEGAWWAAVSSDGTPLRVGQKVRVAGLDGLTLIVEPVAATTAGSKSDSERTEGQEKPDV
jgi:membrane-bound serine protease (ClpP class)